MDKNYTTEKVLLSIEFATKKIRTYLLWNTVVIRTNHQAMAFLKTWKLTYSWLTTWALVLQEYNFIWEYIRGAAIGCLTLCQDEYNKISRDIKEIDFFKVELGC